MMLPNYQPPTICRFPVNYDSLPLEEGEFDIRFWPYASPHDLEQELIEELTRPLCSR